MHPSLTGHVNDNSHVLAVSMYFSCYLWYYVSNRMSCSYLWNFVAKELYGTSLSKD